MGNKRTPGKWETDGQHLFPVGDSPNILACLYVPRGGTKVLIANTEFVIRACNAHDELVAALRLAEWSGYDSFAQRRCPVCLGKRRKEGHYDDCKLAAAIALATEANDGELSLADDLNTQDREVVPIESGPRRKRDRLFKVEGDM